MTKSQQQAQRELERAQANWLMAYGWKVYNSYRWTHRSAPETIHGYTTQDAMQLTRAEPLRYVP